MKVINYESFYNDYSVSQLNCNDLSIASYIGQENKNIYYIYCFLISALSNYDNDIFKNIVYEKDYEDAIRLNVLKMLDYVQEYIFINSKEELYSTIKECVDNKEPLMMDVKYQTLFFYKNYLDPFETKFTTMIANGYNDDNNTINVLDMSLERQTFSKLFKGEFLYSLQLPIDMLYDIISKTLDLTNAYEDFFAKGSRSLFYIIKKNNDNPMISSLDEAISFYNSLINNQDMIIPALAKLKDINNYKPNALEVIMKRHVNSYQVIIDVLNKYEKNYPNYSEIKERNYSFIQKRRIMIASLSRQYIKNHYIDEDTFADCQNKIKDNIALIMNFTLDNELDDESINYVKFSQITASTMLTDATYMANKNVNIKEDCWLSKVTTFTHWLQFDLLSIKHIESIVIYHYGEETLNTRDFTVLGSIDGVNYSKIISIEGNEKDVTEFSNLNVDYRYIKLDITGPCQFDSRARIRNVIIK